jgi:hypothetical protein
MHRTRSTWVLLLALFLGLFPRASRLDLLGGGATVRATADAGAPEAYVRVAARMLPALETLSPTHRQTPPAMGVLLADATLPHVTNLRLGAHPRRSAARSAEQARHFPLFPTGPPSHT